MRCQKMTASKTRMTSSRMNTRRKAKRSERRRIPTMMMTMMRMTMTMTLPVADDLCNKWKESCLETITRCAFR